MSGSRSERTASASNDTLPHFENFASYFLPHDNLFALLFEQNLVESMNSPLQDQAANILVAGGSSQGQQLDSISNIRVSSDDDGQDWEVDYLANEGVLLDSETHGEGRDLV